MRKKSNKTLLSRREFLKQSGMAISSVSCLSMLTSMAMIKPAHAAYTDYKALVCVFLHGGNDSYNMLMPYEVDEHASYLQARSGQYLVDSSGLGLPRVSSPVTDAISGRQFGIHESMPEVKALFDVDPADPLNINRNKLAFIANVGTLNRPTTRAEYNANSNLPSGLFSHSDQQLQWMTGRPDLRSEKTGWAGRLLREMDTVDNSDVNKLFRNISLHHTNRMQTAGSIIPYVVGSTGATQLSGYNTTSDHGLAFTSVVDSLLRNTTYSNKFESTYADIHRVAIDGAADFQAATSNVVVTPFETDDLSKQLEMVAKIIQARNDLGNPGRQIFMVELGGWDMHDSLMTNHGPRLQTVSKALGDFATAMESNGMQNDVTTFTISDFARTLNSNGDGSDHGWGGNHIIMGGAVDGGKIYGQYPADLSNPTGIVTQLDGTTSVEQLDTGRGRLIPTTSLDEYYADLALWYGVPYAQLTNVFPNLQYFSLPSNEAPPVGLFRQV